MRTNRYTHPERSIARLVCFYDPLNPLTPSSHHLSRTWNDFVLRTVNRPISLMLTLSGTSADSATGPARQILNPSSPPKHTTDTLKSHRLITLRFFQTESRKKYRERTIFPRLTTLCTSMSTNRHTHSPITDHHSICLFLRPDFVPGTVHPLRHLRRCHWANRPSFIRSSAPIHTKDAPLFPSPHHTTIFLDRESPVQRDWSIRQFDQHPPFLTSLHAYEPTHLP